MKTIAILLLSILTLSCVSAYIVSSDNAGVTISPFNFSNISAYAGDIINQNVIVTNKNNYPIDLIVIFELNPTNILYTASNSSLHLNAGQSVIIPANITIARNSEKGSIDGKLNFYLSK